jgi:N-methylhydantoinase B
VARDVRWGKVSFQGARDDYGVVVGGPRDDPVVDEDASEELRASLRAARTGQEPFFDRGPGYAVLAGRPHADVDHLGD